MKNSNYVFFRLLLFWWWSWIGDFWVRVSVVELNRWPGLVVADRLSRLVWRLWVAMIQVVMGGWIDATATILISFNRRLIVVGLGSWFLGRFWTWVMVSWLFLGLWFGGYVNFVEIFGFLGGCLLVVSRFVVSRCLFVVRRVCKYCWNF